MELIIGGVYQGKLDHAVRKYGFSDEDIFFCTDEPWIDTEKRCIYGLEKYIRACVRTGTEPVVEFADAEVVICQDIFSGLVPVDPADRAWREAAGRAFTKLAQRADTVTRIFCGIAQNIK